MNCPQCQNENIKVVSSRLIPNKKRRRRLECSSCLHRWNEIFDRDHLIEWSYRPDSVITDDQVREILLRRDLSERVLAKLMQRSRATIWKIRRGLMYQNIAIDIPRWNIKSLSCVNCSYWRGRGKCFMDQPDLAEEGVSFANDCELYSEK